MENLNEIVETIVLCMCTYVFCIQYKSINQSTCAVCSKSMFTFPRANRTTVHAHTRLCYSEKVHSDVRFFFHRYKSRKTSSLSSLFSLSPTSTLRTKTSNAIATVLPPYCPTSCSLTYRSRLEAARRPHAPVLR